MRLLVRTPNWLGDIVMALPALSGAPGRFAAPAVDLSMRLLVRTLDWPGDVVMALPVVSGAGAVRRPGR